MTVKETKRRRTRAQSVNTQQREHIDGHWIPTDTGHTCPSLNSDEPDGNKGEVSKVEGHFAFEACAVEVSSCATVDAATQTAYECNCCAWLSDEVHASTPLTDAQVVRLMSSVL
jgi:hypothetical protein